MTPNRQSVHPLDEAVLSEPFCRIERKWSLAQLQRNGVCPIGRLGQA